MQGFRREIDKCRRSAVPFLFLVALVFFEFPLRVMADIPSSFTFQGSLKEDGSLVNGSYPMSFKITDENGSQIFWDSGPKTVTVVEGLYQIELSPAQVNWGTITPYIETSVNGTVLLPREKLNSTPYSFVAQNLAAGATAEGDLNIKGAVAINVPNKGTVDLFTNAADGLLLKKTGNNRGALVLKNDEMTSTTNGSNVLTLINKSASIIGSIYIGKYANGYSGTDDAGLPMSNSGRIGVGADNISRWVWLMGTTPQNDGIYFEGGMPRKITAHMTFDGQLRMGGGDAGSPAFGFYQDEGTGLFHSGVNNLGLSTNGQSRLNISPTGNVGVGTGAPADKLDVNGNILLRGALRDENLLPAFFVNVLADDGGGSHPYLGCPSGFAEAGRWHAGTGRADGFLRGIGYTNGTISSGWMCLCVAQ